MCKMAWLQPWLGSHQRFSNQLWGVRRAGQGQRRFFHFLYPRFGQRFESTGPGTWDRSKSHTQRGSQALQVWGGIQIATKYIRTYSCTAWKICDSLFARSPQKSRSHLKHQRTASFWTNCPSVAQWQLLQDDSQEDVLSEAKQDQRD